ncbi:hypothetical protein QE250_01735 [Chromatiaceae bacterium AAb-1]|nr:hypothetical protein [Chromatiaceae bacterium AAb-1]
MKRLLSSSLVFLLISCSSEHSETVSFKPEKGDEHHYRVYSHTTVQTDYRNMGLSTDMMVGYKVRKVGELAEFDISVDAFRLNADGRSISNFNAAEDEPELHALMSQGFEADIRLKDNSIARFTAKNQQLWQAMMQDKGAQLQEELNKMLQAPAVPGTFPAIKGHSFTLAGYLGAPEVTLTVSDVTDKSVLLTLSADENGTRIYGKLFLNRKNGWLERLAVVSEVPFDNGYVEGTARSVILMLPQSQYVGNLSNPVVSDDTPYEYQWPDELTDDWLQRANRQLTEKEIFPQPAGMFQNESYDGETLRLNYPHRMSPVLAEGELELRNPVFLADDNQPLPVTLAPYKSYLVSWFDDEYQSLTSLFLTGWDVSDEQLYELQAIEADAVYHHARLVPVTLAVSASEPVQLDHEDVTAILTPVTGEKNTFLLSLTASETRWFSFYMQLGGKVMMQQVAGKSDASWLNSAESALLSLATASGYARTWKVVFDEVPQEIMLYVNERTGETTQRRLSFINPMAYEADPQAIPLKGDRFLYQDDEFSFYTTDAAPVPAVVTLAELEPEQAEHSLAITLSSEQAAVCELTILQAPQVNGHKLKWLPVADKTYRYISFDEGLILSRQQRWQLASEDGIRQYFYDIEVKSRLACKGEPVWQTLVYDDEDSFWLVNLTELDPELDLSLPVAEFIRQYRFLNRNGKALALSIPPALFDSGTKVQQLPLQALLTDGKWLKIAGRAVAAEKVVLKDKPLIREWTTHFAPLP